MGFNNKIMLMAMLMGSVLDDLSKPHPHGTNCYGFRKPSKEKKAQTLAKKKSRRHKRRFK